ncbi:MAG TPA: hypothetical protein VEB21_12845 [Terriglobales bacterium]|nr:hypothetical protein [Terriglobales bacterium]
MGMGHRFREELKQQFTITSEAVYGATGAVLGFVAHGWWSNSNPLSMILATAAGIATGKALLAAKRTLIPLPAGYVSPPPPSPWASVRVALWFAMIAIGLTLLTWAIQEWTAP